MNVISEIINFNDKIQIDTLNIKKVSFFEKMLIYYKILKIFNKLKLFILLLFRFK